MPTTKSRSDAYAPGPQEAGLRWILRRLMIDCGYGQVLDAYRSNLEQLRADTHNDDERQRLDNLIAALPRWSGQ